MKNYDHLAPLVGQENPAFEEFYADMQSKIAALKGRGAITIQPSKFKQALKVAYIAGDQDAILRLINSHSDT